MDLFVTCNVEEGDSPAHRPAPPNQAEGEGGKHGYAHLGRVVKKHTWEEKGRSKPRITARILFRLLKYYGVYRNIDTKADKAIIRVRLQGPPGTRKVESFHKWDQVDPTLVRQQEHRCCSRREREFRIGVCLQFSKQGFMSTYRMFEILSHQSRVEDN